MNYNPKYLLNKLETIEENPDNTISALKCDCGCKAFKVFKRFFKKTNIDKEFEKIITKNYTSTSIQIVDDNTSVICKWIDNNGNIIHQEDITNIMQIFKNQPEEYEYILAECRECKKNVLVFDERIYGYNGIISNYEKNQNYSNNYVDKQTIPCSKCKTKYYKVIIRFYSTGKEDIIKNLDSVFNEDNWTNAFEWITINLQCNLCGKEKKNWFDFETM